MLEEQHRVIAADGGPQQPVGVERGGRAHYAEAGNGGEHRGAGLRVVWAAASQVSAVRDAHHDGGAERVARAPAQRGELASQLMVGGPDVVEELDLDDRLQPPRRESDRAAHDARLSERRVVHSLASEMALESPGDLEHPTLPLHLGEMLLAA